MGGVCSSPRNPAWTAFVIISCPLLAGVGKVLFLRWLNKRQATSEGVQVQPVTEHREVQVTCKHEVKSIQVQPKTGSKGVQVTVTRPAVRSEEVQVEPKYDSKQVQAVDDQVPGHMKVINLMFSGRLFARGISLSELNGRRIFKFLLINTWKDESIRARRFQLGSPPLCETQMNVLLIGQDCCKKRAFVDALANHALGIMWEDNFTIDVTSHTDNDAQSSEWAINIYTIPSTTYSKMHFTVNVIDIPSFAPDQNCEEFEKVLNQLTNLLKDPSTHGIDCLHAVVFFYYQDHSELHPLYTYLHQYITGLFKHEMQEYIHNFFTSSTVGSDLNSKLNSQLATAGIPNNARYQFYFAHLFDETASLPESLVKDEWYKTQSNLLDFLGKLEAVKPLSLTMDHKQLKRREMIIEGLLQLYILIREGCQDIGNAKEEERLITSIAPSTPISEVRIFNYEIYRFNKTKRELAYSGEQVTNCSVCFVTCHDQCKIKEDDQKKRCKVMKEGKCTVCPKRCKWNKHFNRAFVVSVKVEQTQASFPDMVERYKQNKITTVSDLAGAIRMHMRKKGNNVKEYMKQSIQHVKLIHGLSGRQAHASPRECLDEIIHVETRDKMDGWKERVALLQQYKKEVEVEMNMEGNQ